MLYDQAQLAVALADTFAVSDFHRSAPCSTYLLKITSDELLGQTLKDLISYVERDLCHSEHGGFYCAEDADSLPTKTSTKKKEGTDTHSRLPFDAFETSSRRILRLA